jgi:hypothetical protein
MRSTRLPWLLAAALVATLAVGACSSNDSKTPTSPGGGTQLSLALPAGGGSATKTFGTNDERIGYKCGIHPAMTGDTVIVSSASSVESVLVTVVSMTAPGFSPSTVTVKPGGKVRWVTPMGAPHTVVNQ